MEKITIDKYETALEGKEVVYYAVKGKTKYRMPDCYSDMYTDDYLAIAERVLERPELYDTEKSKCEPKHYIPLRTSL